MSVVFSLDIKRCPKTTPDGSHADKNGLYLKGDTDSSVILIHGLTGTPNEVRFLANFLNKNGFSVVCPRLARHGEPLHILKKAKWREFYDSARRVLTEGELAHAKGPIFASGLSMGALLALLLADEFKERITAVSCLAPTLFYDGWNTPLSKYLLPLACTPLRYLYYLKEDPPYGIKNEAIRQRIHKYYNSAKFDDLGNVEQFGYPYFPVSLLYELQLLVKYLTKRLAHIKAPVQLIQAKDDDMTSVKNSKFIYDRISSDTKEIALLYNSYHVITADQERDVVADRMNEFFRRVTPRPQL